MDNFNLKKFLIESKMTRNSRLLNENEGTINENESPQLTDQERNYLDGEVEKFLNNALFSSDIVADDSENFSPTREERAIQFIIDALKERISYY